MSRAAGYSGTPLAQKLGIKEGTTVLAVSAPDGYLQLLEPLPPAVQFVDRLSKAIDVVHVFAINRSELKKSLAMFRRRLKRKHDP